MKNRNNPGAFPELVDLANYSHSFYFKGHEIPKGAVGAAKVDEIWRKGFDKMNVVIKVLEAHGDKVVEYSGVTAHHSGEFCGYEPMTKSKVRTSRLKKSTFILLIRTTKSLSTGRSPHLTICLNKWLKGKEEALW